MAQKTELALAGVPGRRHAFSPKADSGASVPVGGWELAARPRTWTLAANPRVWQLAVRTRTWELPTRPA